MANDWTRKRKKDKSEEGEAILKAVKARKEANSAVQEVVRLLAEKDAKGKTGEDRSAMLQETMKTLRGGAKATQWSNVDGCNGPSACKQVFSIPELADEIFHVIFLSGWDDEDDIDNTPATWEEAKNYGPGIAYGTVGRLQRVCRPWQQHITQSQYLQYEMGFIADPSGGTFHNVDPNYVHPPGCTSNDCPRMGYWSENEFVGNLMHHESYVFCTAGSQYAIRISTECLQHYKDLFGGSQVKNLLLTNPPFTILDIVALDWTHPGFYTVEGERVDQHREDLNGNRLFSHHKATGFTIRDLMKVVESAQERVPGLTSVIVKSVDHIKERRMAMIKCEEAEGSSLDFK